MSNIKKLFCSLPKYVDEQLHVSKAGRKYILVLIVVYLHSQANKMKVSGAIASCGIPA